MISNKFDKNASINKQSYNIYKMQMLIMKTRILRTIKLFEIKIWKTAKI